MPVKSLNSFVSIFPAAYNVIHDLDAEYTLVNLKPWGKVSSKWSRSTETISDRLQQWLASYVWRKIQYLRWGGSIYFLSLSAGWELKLKPCSAQQPKPWEVFFPIFAPTRNSPIYAHLLPRSGKGQEWSHCVLTCMWNWQIQSPYSLLSLCHMQCRFGRWDRMSGTAPVPQQNCLQSILLVAAVRSRRSLPW